MAVCNRDLMGSTSDVDLTIDNLQPDGTVYFRVHNFSPYRLDHLRLVLVVSGDTTVSGMPKSGVRVSPGSSWPCGLRIGYLVGTYAEDNAGTPIAHPAHAGFIMVKYEDGHGEQALRWDVMIGEGSRFDKREFTISPA